MAAQLEIRKILAELQVIATSGFALALHVRFATPTFLFQTYPKKWLDYYSQNGLVMSDPTVAWGFANTGTIVWDQLEDEDVAGVLKKAGEFGLSYGVSCVTGDDSSRSFCGFARSDRPFTADEVSALEANVQKMHDLTANLQALRPEVSEELRKMSVQFMHSE